MLLTYKNGQTSVILRCKLMDSTSTTGAGLTGLTNNSSNLRIATIADTESSATSYVQSNSPDVQTIETISTLGTYAAPSASCCRFKEVSSTNHPGVYELQFADARLAVSNAKSLLVTVSGATSLIQADFVIQLQSDDPFIAKPTNFASTSIDGSGRVDVIKISGTTQTARDIGASVLLSSGAGTGQLDFTSGVVKSNLTQVSGVSSGLPLDKTLRAIARGTVTTGASTTSVPTSAMTIAGSAASGVVADQFKDRVVLFDGDTTTAGLKGAQATISASSASNTPTLTVGTLPATPASGDLFSII